MITVVRVPHADPTLALDDQGGCDVARAFVGRVVAGEFEHDVVRRMGGSREARRAALLLKAAMSILRRQPGEDARYRAVGAALGALSESSAVHLTLDDLELAQGTTESSADVARAVEAGPLPFQAEIDAAIEQCRGQPRVCIVVDRDQELPGAVALARGLPHAKIELRGAFAFAHRAALLRMDVFHGGTVVETATSLSIAGLAGYETDKPWPQWRSDVPRERRPWAGMVPLATIVDPQRLIGSGCRAVVVGFASIEEQGVLSAEGTLHREPLVRDSIEALLRSGIQVTAEWRIGAPGVNERSLLGTLDRLQRAPLFPAIAGFRLFTWPVNRPAGAWGPVRVDVGNPDTHRDLARSRPFSAPGTLAPDETQRVLQDLVAAIGTRWRLSPGHVAAALVSKPAFQVGPSRGDAVQIDPACAIVDLGISLEGVVGEHWYVVDLAGGSIFGIDRRFGPGLARLERPGRPSESLDTVPGPQRTKVLDALLAKKILRKVDA